MTTILEVQSENNCLSLCQLYSGCQQSHGRGDLKLVMRPDQRGLKEADHFYLELAGRDSFYGRWPGCGAAVSGGGLQGPLLPG